MIDVGLLGTGGTLPLPGRYLSSLLVRSGGQLILIDCGEGTQVSLREMAWGIKDIGTILITHFHADHISGLPGLLLTIGNSGRTREEPLTIVGPKGIQRVVESLRVIAPHLPYPVKYREMFGYPEDEIEVGQLRISSQMGDHDIPCLAYALRLDRLPEFQPERAKALGIPVQQWKVLQKGSPIEHAGRTVQPTEVLGPPRPGLALAYVTDTRPSRALVDFFSDVDLLVSEACYGDPADRSKAIENKHMTFAEAASMAAAAQVKRLVLTHFSPSLPNPEYFKREATAIYSETVIGHDGLQISLNFPD